MLLSDKVRKIIPTVTSRVFILSTYFYSKLTEGGFNYENVARWTLQKKRQKNLFRDFNLVFIPINESGHWSLALIWCMGGYYKLLHLDSLEAHHDHEKIASNIGKYLRMEWHRLKKDGHFEDSTKLPSSLQKLKVDSLSVPRQQNGYDCGMFVCAYSEKIFEEFQEAYQSNLENDDALSVKQDKDEFSINTAVQSLVEKDKHKWFNSKYVKSMRLILKRNINEMSRAQREEEEEEKEEEGKNDVK